MFYNLNLFKLKKTKQFMLRSQDLAIPLEESRKKV